MRVRHCAIVAGVLLLAGGSPVLGQTRKPVPAKPAAAPFSNPYSPEEILGKQAVIETGQGTIILLTCWGTGRCSSPPSGRLRKEVGGR